MFRFGHELEITLADLAELYVVLPTPSDSEQLMEVMERTLTSQIRVEQRPRRIIVEVLDGKGSVWLRSRHHSVFGRYRPTEVLAGHYGPAFPARLPNRGTER